MSARAQARRFLPVALVVAAVVVAGLAVGPPTQDGPPLDPASSGPLGVKGLVDVLEGLGARVDVRTGADALAAADSALVLTDRFDEAEQAAVTAWVREGGTLVVADPASPLSPETVGDTRVAALDVTLERRCGLVALAAAARVAAPGDAVLAAEGAAVGCFPRGDGHWLVATPEGRGAVVALGGRNALLNRELASADNAILLAALLAPAEGTSVAVLQPGLPGEGAATLGDLVPRSVRLALVQLALAFGLVVLWRARRLGRPVIEPQPVAIAASELIGAVGSLHQQTGARSRAAALLREDVRRELAERLGLSHATPPEDLADAVSARHARGGAAVRAALLDRAPANDRELVALAHELEALREEVLSAPRGDPAGAPAVATPQRDGGQRGARTDR